MEMLPAPNCEAVIPPIPAKLTPIEEYLVVLRSYLTADQKAALKDRVESICLRHGMITPARYAETVQKILTPWQKAGVVERLEAIFPQSCSPLSHDS